MKDKNWDDIQRKIAKLGDASTQDYCRKCGESPESGSHIFDHTYEDPRFVMITTQKWSDKAHTQLLTKKDVAESFDKMRKADVIFRVTRSNISARDTFELLALSLVLVFCIAAAIFFLGFYP